MLGGAYRHDNRQADPQHDLGALTELRAHAAHPVGKVFGINADRVEIQHVCPDDEGDVAFDAIVFLFEPFGKLPHAVAGKLRCELVSLIRGVDADLIEFDNRLRSVESAVHLPAGISRYSAVDFDDEVLVDWVRLVERLHPFARSLGAVAVAQKYRRVDMRDNGQVALFGTA